MIDMQTLKITGGQPLNGEVSVSGAKNAATKMMVATLLTNEPVVLYNIPKIGDVDITKDIIEAVGAKVEQDNHTLRIHAEEVNNTSVKHLSRKNRISILTLSPLLHRCGSAEVPIVDGDKIGPRPVDYHIKALQQMGAEITYNDSGYHAKADKLVGATVKLDYPSVGATENILLAAVLAEGRTSIYNAATEPEILDLIKLLQQMGAIIEFRANRVIIVDGVERLHGASYHVMPDRLEAASYAAAAIATGGKITIKNAVQDHLSTFLNTVRRIGGDYRIDDDGITFKRSSEGLYGTELETDTWPGFSTDWQQPLVVVLTQAKGLSVIHETVYEDRFGYSQSLNDMGANIAIFTKCLGEIDCRFKGESHKHSAIIQGPTKLKPAKIDIPDIRAGMAHVVAALVADGTSTLTGVEHLLRGYDQFLDKLESIGANFKVD
ncbi:MAG: UDP-N-acetylglucosamine 1-carboxyvinyltransferase [Candidatus Saccharimonadales bacterium]